MIPLSIGKLIETESRIEFTRNWGKEEMGTLFNGYRVFVCDDKKIAEMDSGDGCTTLWMCLMPLDFTLKIV